MSSTEEDKETWEQRQARYHHEDEKRKARKRELEAQQDRREKMLVAWGILLGAIVLGAIIVAIYLGGNRAADRSQEFRMACLESGGTVRMGECWGSVTVPEDSP